MLIYLDQALREARDRSKAEGRALSLADVVAVMNEGRLVEVGTPQELYERPRSRFTSDFLGGISYLSGRVASRDGASVTIDTSQGPVQGRTAQDIRQGEAVLGYVCH